MLSHAMSEEALARIRIRNSTTNITFHLHFVIFSTFITYFLWTPPSRVMHGWAFGGHLAHVTASSPKSHHTGWHLGQNVTSQTRNTIDFFPLRFLK